MNILSTVVTLAASNGVLKFLENARVILLAAISVLAIVKIAPLMMRGRATQIIGAIAICACVIYFANNTDSLSAIGNYIANMFK